MSFAGDLGDTTVRSQQKLWDAELKEHIAEKSKAITRASRIVLGLQGALDFEKGGELAKNLDELYNYVTRRLLHVNARNDLGALEEIYGLMIEIRSAWESVPELIPRSQQASMAVN